MQRYGSYFETICFILHIIILFSHIRINEAQTRHTYCINELCVMGKSWAFIFSVPMVVFESLLFLVGYRGFGVVRAKVAVIGATFFVATSIVHFAGRVGAVVR